MVFELTLYRKVATPLYKEELVDKDLKSTNCTVEPTLDENCSKNRFEDVCRNYH